MENKYAVSANKMQYQSVKAEGSGKCPECGNRLYYSKKDESVECPYCSCSADVADLLPSTSADEKAPMRSIDYAMKIESPVAALVYLEIFFKEYDWETYKRTAAIEITEIKELIKKIRIKFGDNSTSWILDFESRITPFLKKIESLADLEAEFLSLYKGKMTPAINSKYVLYTSITEEIKNSVESIFDALRTDIEYAERLGEPEDVITGLKNRFNEAAELYTAGVHDFSSIKEIPAIQIVKEKLDRRANRKLHDNGIDAEATYDKAVNLFETQTNKINALRLFEAIRGFRDSDEYIAKINEFFNFDSKLLKLAGKHFLLKKVAAPVFDVKKPEQTEAQAPTESENGEEQKPEIPKIPIKGIGPTVALYEVIDGRIYEPASITGISYILSYYGNRIFYIKKNRSLCSYDVVNRVETELDRGSADDYPREKIYWNKNGTAFYIRKKLPAFNAEKGGCLRAIFSIFRRRPDFYADTKNNFSLIKVDTIENEVSVEIERLVDITECYDDRLFYISYPTEGGAPSFKVCNLRNGKKATVLGDDCHIHNVIGENVIYSTWDPNEYNKMLFSYNLKTDETTLIEANIFEFFATLGDRVYYKVGNNKRAPIFSNNLQGTDRFELIDNIRDIYASFDNWIYIIRGKGRNTTLFKMSDDGKTVVSVCSDIDYIISMTESHTYYVDTKGALHAVDNDGADNRAITNDIDVDNIIIDRDYIYFLRREEVGRDKNSASLYRVDFDGKNIKKLIFNVNKIQNYDDNHIYVYKCATTRFIATETENDEIKSEKQVKYKVTRFSVFDKTAETETEIAALGLPDDRANLEKNGCLKKKVKRTVTYKELSNKISYKKTDIARVGEIFFEQTDIDIPEI